MYFIASVKVNLLVFKWYLCKKLQENTFKKKKKKKESFKIFKRFENIYIIFYKIVQWEINKPSTLQFQIAYKHTS